MLTKELFKLKSDKPSRNTSQEWWTFVHPSGNVEIVLRNWKKVDTSEFIQGDPYFIEELNKSGILDRPSSIDKEFLKEYHKDMERAQTYKVKRKQLTDYL